MKLLRVLGLASLSFTLLAVSARAHFVWLEHTADGPAAFFGEWAEGVRENQDGYLKLITAPKAYASDGSELVVTKQHDRFAVAAAATNGDLRLTERYRPEKGDVLVRYHARLGRTDTSHRLDLELVPVSAGANTFTVVYQGQPVANAEVTLFSAEGWNRKFKAGADGRVTVLTPWAGQYVLEVTHLDKTPGEHAGRAHTSVRNVSTLTFTVAAKS